MKRIQAIRFINALLVLSTVFCGCGRHRDIPGIYDSVATTVSIMPDYMDVSIPPNIAPLNFSVEGDSITDVVASFVVDANEYVYGNGRKVVIDYDDWREMVSRSVGNDISVNVYTQCNGKWRRHPEFKISVTGDSIDPYISYRLIPPYNVFENIVIMQRNLETFDADEFFNNQMLSTSSTGHCINCHSFQNYHTRRMQFHVRHDMGGTVIYDDGKLTKCNLKSPFTISSGVYPSWHPTMNLIAYSTNLSFLMNHTNGECKAEVLDSESDLILYDVENQRIVNVSNVPEQLETYPAWSPDGKWLYYSASDYKFGTPVSRDNHKEADAERRYELSENYQKARYNIYRRSFDPGKMEFGDQELVVDAYSDSLSATLPRISPDGRYLLTCMGLNGNFLIYHPEADLYVTDLQSLPDSVATRPLTEANSTCSDSYHAWSSNGRWIMFQSRRRDNNYTRLYFSWFDGNGKAHKAFELPQKDPDYEIYNIRSYNIPEFMVEPVRTTPGQLAKFVRDNEAFFPGGGLDANSGATQAADGVN